jgi:DNA polymerase-4
MARSRPTILHADLDAFYASVEERRDPSLAGKPFVVGGGVVLSASYEARRYGVSSGMPGREARRRCPRLVVVRGGMSDYSQAADEVFAVVGRFTPFIEKISIDEAFLDVGGAGRHFGDAERIGAALRAAVREETGLVVSVGAARTKFLAKVASAVAKPDGLITVDPRRELEFLHPLPVERVWGVGQVMRRRLAEMGIRTVGELAAVPASTLSAELGRGLGAHLHHLAWNRDPRGVVLDRRAGSVGAQSSFALDERSPEVWRRVLLGLADRVGRRLRRRGRAGRTVTTRVRFADFETVSRRRTLPAPVATTAAIYRTAGRLLDQATEPWQGGTRGVRLLGISISGLRVAPALQLELALDGLDALDDPVTRAGSVEDDRRRRLEAAVDDLRDRFDDGAVVATAIVKHRSPEPLRPLS